ncbi:hypothetical protein PENTCL1PPCAC_20221, partial [Pristionchus entomophagus]
MTIFDSIETTNIAVGLISNSLLILLSLRFNKQTLGTYKHLLMVFAFYDLFLTVLHAVIEPRVYNFGTVFTFHSENFTDNTWMTIIYVSAFTVPFALTNINFLRRYWAVKK